MPPKKKQAPRTGYYFFMLDIREDVEREQRRRVNMEELRVLAGPAWEALSQEEKAMYNARAKAEKKQGAAEVEKYNSLGIAFSTIDDAVRERDEEQSRMKATIKHMIEVPTEEVLIRQRFYLCHVNYYYKQYKDQEDWYCPCEISIVEFSFMDGITDTLHFILHHGELPVGVRADAKELAEKYHDIHLVDKADRIAPYKESNFQLVYGQIVGKLRRGSSKDARGREILPPIFTMPNSVNQNHCLTAVRNALTKFSESVNERRDLFRVYPLPQLFYELKLRFCEDFNESHGISILENEIEKDQFAAAPDLECYYHKDSENYRFCSQSVCYRWAYTLMDHICVPAGIKILPGAQSPKGFQAYNPSALKNSWSDENIITSRKDVENLTSKEMHLRYKEEVKEEVKRAEALPAPRSTRGWNTPSAASSQADDFPVLGFPPLGRAGHLPRQAPGRPNASGSVWPVSTGKGRGRLLEKK